MHSFAEQTDSNFYMIYRSIYSHPQLRHLSLPSVFPQHTQIKFLGQKDLGGGLLPSQLLQENCQKKPAWDSSWWEQPKLHGFLENVLLLYHSFSAVCCLCNDCFTSISLIRWSVLFLYFLPFLFSHPHFTICFLFIWFPSNAILQKRGEEHLWSKHPNFCQHSSEHHCLCIILLFSPHLYLIYLYFKLCSTDTAYNFLLVQGCIIHILFLPSIEITCWYLTLMYRSKLSRTSKEKALVF